MSASGLRELGATGRRERLRQSLVIVSDARHYLDESGRLHVLSPLAAQLDCWARLFAKVTVVAPLAKGSPPLTHSPYLESSISLMPIRQAGGDSTKAKLHLAACLPGWLRTLRSATRSCDAVLFRCPNNISILGLLLYQQVAARRFALYTGNWGGYEGEPGTYRWQRLRLGRWSRGLVGAYGRWPNQPPHVVETFSPSFSEQLWLDAAPIVEAKTARWRQYPASAGRPLRLAAVGGLDRNKNHEVILRAVRLLRSRGVSVSLDLVGQGPLRGFLMDLSRELGIADGVRFRGALSHPEVLALHQEVDLLVQSSWSEGFPKAVAEALLMGTVVAMSTTSSHSAVWLDRGIGLGFAPSSPQGLADAISSAAGPSVAVEQISAGRTWARTVTIERYQGHVSSLVSGECAAPDPS